MHGVSVFLVYLCYRRSLPSPHADWESSSSSLGPFHICHHDSWRVGSCLDHLIAKLLCMSLTWASTLSSAPATHKLIFTCGTATVSKSSGKWKTKMWLRLRGLPLEPCATVQMRNANLLRGINLHSQDGEIAQRRVCLGSSISSKRVLNLRCWSIYCVPWKSFYLRQLPWLEKHKQRKSTPFLKQ